jgi:hypothetical protein
MSTRFVKFTDDKAANRAILAQNVEGIECTYAGAATAEDVDRALDVTPGQCGSAEHYSNGARNIFIRNFRQEVIGVVLVRP